MQRVVRKCSAGGGDCVGKVVGGCEGGGRDSVMWHGK